MLLLIYMLQWMNSIRECYPHTNYNNKGFDMDNSNN